MVRSSDGGLSRSSVPAGPPPIRLALIPGPQMRSESPYPAPPHRMTILRCETTTISRHQAPHVPRALAPAQRRANQTSLPPKCQQHRPEPREINRLPDAADSAITRIGKQHPDSLITYPDRSFLSRSVVPIQMQRHRPHPLYWIVTDTSCVCPLRSIVMVTVSPAR